MNQGKLTRAWALAVASIAWDARPDMSASALEGILNPIGDQLDCEECRGQLRDRVSRVVHEWSLVKVSYVVMIYLVLNYWLQRTI